MFYISVTDIANKFPNKQALNNLTYSMMLEKAMDRDYSLICKSEGIDILLDLIKAASINKPLVVLPKDNKENAILPDTLPDSFALVLYSSGSTGVRKPIVLPERMIMASIRNIIKIHNLTDNDRVLTVCSLNHTAGLTCQTLGAIFTGATVIVEPFNPFSLIRLLSENEITVSHILPIMTESVMKIKEKPNLPQLRFIWTGSDCIPKSHVEYWMDKNRSFMVAYGMTEAGPPATYHIFNYGDDLSPLDIGYAVGTQVLCESKLVDDELCLRGDIINKEGWLHTGDCFKIINGWYYYTGRKSAGGKIIPKGKH